MLEYIKTNYQEIVMKFIPKYDVGYIPMIEKLNDYRRAVKAADNKPLKIAVERNKGYNFIYNIDILNCK